MTFENNHRSRSARMFRASLAALIAVFLGSSLSAPDAQADPHGVLSFDGTYISSTDPDNMTDSRGFGAAMRIVGKREPYNIEVGGFAALGQSDGQRLMRDVYDIHLNVGLNRPSRKRRLLIPFVSVGIDFLYVATRSPEGQSAAGMTMGMNARGGLFGFLAKDWMYTANVSYIGAVVPGTGAGLDGVVFQVGIGKRLFD